MKNIHKIYYFIKGQNFCLKFFFDLVKFDSAFK